MQRNNESNVMLAMNSGRDETGIGQTCRGIICEDEACDASINFELHALDGAVACVAMLTQ